MHRIHRITRDLGRDPAELTKKMAEIAAAKKLTRRTPNRAEPSLPRVLEY